LAHELRNPLVPLRAGVSLIRLAGNDAAAIAEHCSIMERQLDKLGGIVDDLRDVTWLAEGRLPLRRSRVDLQTIAHSAIDDCRDLVEVAGHTLVVRLPSEPVPIHGDPSRLAQVLTNLVSNAAKFTPQGGTIEVSAEREGDTVLLSIADDGLGIPGDRLATIFEPFGQIDRSLETGYRGLGLGLTLVKALVELHGGTVVAYSDGLGKGSRFSVRLPVAGHEEPVVVSLEAPLSRSPAVRRRVLLCEDNRDVARSVARLVRVFGHEIRVAFDGREALQIGNEFRPDVVLMDIGLPGMNGYDVGREIRSRPWGSALALIALTGWGSETDKLRALEAGFDEHLTKPVESHVLEAALRDGTDRFVASTAAPRRR
jgi:CheY-like chemotaxis protein